MSTHPDVTVGFDSSPSVQDGLPVRDYRVADIALADWGRQEIQIAEGEMPALMVIRAKYRNQ
ncbi:MAG: adenosylhomocysteinase, partial [Endozoicomonas sp.]